MPVDTVDLCPGVRVLKHSAATANVVAFGGLRPQGGFGAPAFEFVRTLSELSYNVVFVRDLTQRWFNFGIDNFSSDMDDTATQITAVIQRSLDPSLPLYTIGNSAGGYASIFYGEALAAHVALAICPQTLISMPTLQRFGDKGWPQLTKFEPTVPDLRAHVTGRARKIHIASGWEKPADMVHAGNLAGCANVAIEPIRAKHDVATKWQATEGGLAMRVKERFES
ncbi:hypothetical protein [Shinella sp. WSJ-2]|uniref:hypothetical protein n=1 Tax=Shinella sp. WSJ-2 TaxID=2303749 RepID=UPI0011C114CA|nr:hypothetical protein [Shinella sp. WSJ-2]